MGRNCTFRHPSRISLGDNVTIDDNTLIDARGAERERARHQRRRHHQQKLDRPIEVRRRRNRKIGQSRGEQRGRFLVGDPDRRRGAHRRAVATSAPDASTSTIRPRTSPTRTAIRRGRSSSTRTSGSPRGSRSSTGFISGKGRSSPPAPWSAVTFLRCRSPTGIRRRSSSPGDK